MKYLAMFILAFCTSFGCSDTAVSPKLKATVASTQNPDSVDWNVVITQSNESSRKVYLRQRDDCIGFWRLEKKVGDKWVPAEKGATSYSSVYPGGRTMIRRGEALRDSFRLTQAGTYRLWFPFSWDENGTESDSLEPEEFVAE